MPAEPIPRLRPLHPDAAARSEPRPPRGSRWIPSALGAALVLALALLVWSRLQLGQRIESLEGEVATLRESVAERDEVIAAQGARLDDVRRSVGQLQQLLDRPLPSLEP